jgi:hypothetical protein
MVALHVMPIEFGFTAHLRCATTRPLSALCVSEMRPKVQYGEKSALAREKKPARRLKSEDVAQAPKRYGRQNR